MPEENTTQSEEKPEENNTSSSINTEGGALIDGGISTNGGDLVGRDQYHVQGDLIIGQPSAQSEPDDTPTPGEPPYKGLLYFDTTDAPLFFGREKLTAELVGRLRKQRFLAVIGASGSGKSSVVRAGLVPALQAGEALADGSLPPKGSQNWPVRVITPTEHPLKELATALTNDIESVTAATTLLDDMAKDTRSLDMAVSRLLQRRGGERLLLVVDQFEETFTSCKDLAERKASIDNLVHAVSDETAGKTIIVITLRADFYHHCAEYAGLREVLEKHQAFIGAMDREELRRAVEEPAKRGGWEFEPGLVDLQLDEATGEPGALPLLSHALLETWKRRRGNKLTLQGYQEAGGIKGAIACTADRLMEEFDEHQKAIARNIFLRLTELGEGTQDTRRRAALEELAPQTEEQETARWVLKALADARLVTTGQGTAEVAHEALIREWRMLRGWLDEDREELRLHRHLTEAAKEWEERDRDPSEMYRGTRLTQAEMWERENKVKMSPSEREFLAACRAEQSRQGRAARRRMLTLFGVVTAALAAIAVISTLALTGQMNRFIYRPLPMEYVDVPAGEFEMGSNDGGEDEQPIHIVYLDAYQIGKYEVMNEQYRQCVLAGICGQPGNQTYNAEEFSLHPITDVSWYDARTFCKWSGGRLPTEAEWEKAARGTDSRTYPWGEGISCALANYDGKDGVNDYCVGDTIEVGSYPDGASPDGALDMAGNVWEWTSSLYQGYPYDANDGREDPDDTGIRRGLRGGSWNYYDRYARSANRYSVSPGYRDSSIGFRCAASR